MRRSVRLIICIVTTLLVFALGGAYYLHACEDYADDEPLALNVAQTPEAKPADDIAEDVIVSSEGNMVLGDSDVEQGWEGESENQDDVPAGWVSVDDDDASAQSASSASGSSESDTVAQGQGGQNKPKPKEDPADVRLKYEDLFIEIDYEKLLKNPNELGFVPGDKLFREVYLLIRSSFVDPVTNDQLFNGMVNELGRMLKAAHVSADGLKTLDKRRNILSQLKERYGHKIDSRVLTFSAIQGMLTALKDPHTILMTPDDYNSLQEQVQTKGFGGCGVYIEIDKEAGNQLTIFEPIEGTPAAKAGLEAGDQILALDGKSTKGMTIDVASATIRGPIGSKIVFKIRRKGVANPFTVAVTREEIHVVSATSKMVAGNIGYIRLRQFGLMTSDELAAEIAKVKNAGARGMILDLRNNGGGYVDAAIGVVGQFTRRGSLVVYTLDRNKARKNYTTRMDGGIGMPLVVMINQYSASASEITAGALRDHGLAKLVGVRSFGKGSVQQVFPFSDNSALKMTIARFYSPAGHVIDRKGLEPDVNIKMEPRFVGKDGKDVQLNKAIEVLHKFM